MANPFGFWIRIFAFMRKEIIEVLRQPRLLITLVIGPFLILLLFGIGYRSEGRVLTTMFVVQAGDPMIAEIQKYAQAFRSQLKFEGITSDEAKALKALRDGKVDLVVSVPGNAVETIRQNRQAIFTLYHNEIDPYQSDYIRFTGELYVSKLNDQVLSNFAEQRKQDVYRLHQELKNTIDLTRRMRMALEQKQVVAAQRDRTELENKVKNLETLILASGASLPPQESGSVQSTVSQIRSTLDSVPEIDENKQNYDDETHKLVLAEVELNKLNQSFEEFRTIDARVLLAPFASRTEQIATLKPKLSQYFAPSVIILLLQHLAVTFAALSMIKEFRAGTVELFRVSPLRPLETLIGKYIGYMILGGFVAVLLSALLIYALKVPMLGRWTDYFWVIVVLLFTSLGLGFLISLIAKTDSQAVQYAMILLLTTIFFSGFLMSLRLLWEPVRAVSWILPATYGINLLQNVMLRGFLAINILAILLTIGIVLAVFSLLLFRRRMAQL